MCWTLSDYLQLGIDDIVYSHGWAVIQEVLYHITMRGN